MIKGAINVLVVEGRNVKDMDAAGTGDPYVELWIDPAKKVRTDTRTGTATPVWIREYDFNIDNQESLHLRVLDQDFVSSDEVGKATVDLRKVFNELWVDQWVSLPSKEGMSNGEVRLVIEFTPSK